MHRSVLIAFDFDHTISDDNTDVVVRKLLPKEKLTDSVKNLCRPNGWIAYMAKIFELLHSSFIDVRQIRSAIANIPAVPGMEKLLRELHTHGCEIIIISDSNTLFLSEWLKHRKLDDTIAEVFTNPATVDDKGMIKLDMYHVQDSCKLSTINLCKGQILQGYIKKRKDQGMHFDRVVYIGDGKNDLCPILRLSERDLVFPRKDCMLFKIITGQENFETPKVKARVFPWSDGNEILTKLQEEIGLPKNSL